MGQGASPGRRPEPAELELDLRKKKSAMGDYDCVPLPNAKSFTKRARAKGKKEMANQHKMLIHKKNRSKIHRSLDEHVLHQVKDDSVADEQAAKLSRYEQYLRRALLEDIHETREQSLQDVQQKTKLQRLQEHRSELQRLTSIQRNRADLRTDERLDKAFAMNSYESLKHNRNVGLFNAASLDGILDGWRAGQ